MEQTREIPRNDWNSFFDSFSRQHEGWLSTLEVFSSDVGAQEQARELPLEGISISTADDNNGVIAISLGKTPEDHLTHTIIHPQHVWLEQAPSGADSALEIESGKTKTLLRFRSPMPPEMVDDVI